MCWLVLICVDSCLARVDSCRALVDSCWLVSGSCWLVSDSCWFVLTRADSVDLCWSSFIRIELINGHLKFFSQKSQGHQMKVRQLKVTQTADVLWKLQGILVNIKSMLDYMLVFQSYYNMWVVLLGFLTIVAVKCLTLS